MLADGEPVEDDRIVGFRGTALGGVYGDGVAVGVESIAVCQRDHPQRAGVVARGRTGGCVVIAVAAQGGEGHGKGTES